MSEESQKGPTSAQPKVKIPSARLPWLSILAALGVMAYLQFLIQPDLVVFYQLPSHWFSPEISYAVLGAFALLLLADLRRFQRRRQLQAIELKALARQMDRLWQRNRDLRLKAHTYSGHADKLKLFISDKLLEYIEYDEKYLHFKGIAKEVRHNGVISFDKVQTALEQAGTAARRHSESGAEYQEALDAMRYLWDLLDLSTADNLALHISDLLCECEEHYCQLLLNPDAEMPLPFEPTFTPQIAAWRALNLVRSEALPRPDGQTPYEFEDRQWHIRLEAVSELLGNENHLILMLDNLLKNAQFFSRKAISKTPSPAISLILAERQGQACLQVYNRGPHIQENDHSQLFKLGFSTRRSREHHGRGLGLYFVNEIVKGYEGMIRVENIHIPKTQYDLRLIFDNDQVLTQSFTILPGDDERPRLLLEPSDLSSLESDSQAASQTWQLDRRLSKMEVVDRNGETMVFEDLASKGKQILTDPRHPGRAQWRLSYQVRRKQPTLSLEALDTNGVLFEIQLPSAQSRLDNDQAAIDDGLETEVEQLDGRFQSPLK